MVGEKCDNRPVISGVVNGMWPTLGAGSLSQSIVLDMGTLHPTLL